MKYKFTFHLKSDGGKVKVSTTGTDLKEAIERVLDQEFAPFNAIFRIDIKLIG